MAQGLPKSYLQHPKKKSYLCNHTEWDEDHFWVHRIITHAKKYQKQKSIIKLERKYYGTNDYITNGTNLYPVLLLQIFQVEILR